MQVRVPTITAEVAVAMKWLNRIAQAFRPGSIGNNIRPEGATEIGAVRPRRHHLSTVVQYDVTRGSVRSPFQGESRGGVIPGLKAWAVLFCHFMAEAQIIR